MIEKERKSEIVAQHSRGENDTGSVEVQVALLTERINQLTEHLKVHSHDHHSLRALFKMIGQRKRFLTYLNKADSERYYSLIERLGLRK